MNPAETEQPSPPGVSGKVVIVGIVTVAVVAAGVSWWFRFNATHLAASFWGPQMARIISESTSISLTHMSRNEGGLVTTNATRDVSHAPGITHLRTALLEDRSFVWPANTGTPPAPAAWRLTFAGDSPDEKASVLFTPDLNYVFYELSSDRSRGVSCTPTMSAGILELFTEMMDRPAAAGPPAAR
jgi:hypothetical protein